jgi:hypothetical protein
MESRMRSFKGATGFDCRTRVTRAMRFEPPSAIAVTADGAGTGCEASSANVSARAFG